MPVRLKDIAADLGISLVTVSKVLRNKSDVSAETRRRVLQRVEELNYRPNMMARSLASGRTHTIGLVVPDIADSFFAELARSLGAALRARSFQLILASADENPQVEKLEVENLLARGVDALLIASCQKSSAAIQAVLDQSIPCILIDRTLTGMKAHFVGTDDVRAGIMATEHLANLGRRRIAHIGIEGISTSVERLEGYQQALKTKGLRHYKELVLLKRLDADRGDRLGRAAMDELLSQRTRPDAVFCYNDLIAVGAIRSILAHKLRVPEDIAIIGCGNLSLSSYLEVSLSSVDQRTAQLGEQAAKLALALLDGELKKQTKTILIEPVIVARASTLGANFSSDQ